MSSKTTLQGSLAMTPEIYTFPKIFIKHQIRPNPKPSFEGLSVVGQTALITGGNAGIGLESGRILLSRKLKHLILGVRSLQRGEEAADQLRKEYSQARVDVWHLDMNSYDSVKEFAKRCHSLDRLDIALLSAGIMNTHERINPTTGFEEMFQVNYLSTALLAVELLPILKTKRKDGRCGRLTLVASGAALIAEFPERDGNTLLSSFRKSDDWNSTVAKKAYDTSKGVVLMLALKLSSIIAAEDVIVNVVDPSFTPGTGFFRDLPLLLRIAVWPLTKLLGTTVNNAAWRYIDAVVARGKESHGSFISDWEIHRFHHFMYTDAGVKYMDRLWRETVKELSLGSTDVAGIST